MDGNYYARREKYDWQKHKIHLYKQVNTTFVHTNTNIHMSTCIEWKYEFVILIILHGEQRKNKM